MVTKVGINGFGRIGRSVLRVALQNPDIEVVAINDPFMEPEYMAYMFKYDSNHDRYQSNVAHQKGQLQVDGHKMAVFAENNPAQIPWGKYGADYVMESTGVFTTADKASAHLKGGAKMIAILVPSVDTPVFVVGGNLDSYKSGYQVITNADCTTNRLAPQDRMVDDHFGIVEGLATRVYGITAMPKTLDDTSGEDWHMGKDAEVNTLTVSHGSGVNALSAATESGANRLPATESGANRLPASTSGENRLPAYTCTGFGTNRLPTSTSTGSGKNILPSSTNAGANLSPASTEAAKAGGDMIAKPNGRLTEVLFRVPDPDAPVVDHAGRLEKPRTYGEIKAVIKKTSDSGLERILDYAEDEAVSTGFLGDPHARIFDPKAGISLNPHFPKLISV